MSELSRSDIELIATLEFEPDSKPSFEALKGCLVWADEAPLGLSSSGHERINELLAARGMIHLGTDPANLPEPYRSSWMVAVESKFSWNGFRRLSLSAADRKYLVDEMQYLEESDDGI